jgi:electron transfer flavoprotein beta subunit
MGPPSCAFTLYEAMAMGADRGVLISDPALSGSDTLATSAAIGAAINKLTPFDLVLFGTRTADSDTGQVGPETAVLLDLPLVTGARVIEKKDEGLHVERSADGFLESYMLSLPAALTVHQAAAQSRDMGLLGIGEAYNQGEITEWNLADIGISPAQVGEKGSPTRLLSLVPAKKGRKCAFLTGSAEEQAHELTKRLAETGLLT